MSPRLHPRSYANNNDHNRRFRDPVPDQNLRAWLDQPGFRSRYMRNSPQHYRARRVRISREWIAVVAAYWRPPPQNWGRATTYAWSACLWNRLAGPSETVRKLNYLTVWGFAGHPQERSIGPLPEIETVYG